MLELMQDWTLEELAVSFLESGFWPQEALIVVKEPVGKRKDDSLVVVEREYDDFAKTCRTRYQGRNFDEVEGDLRREWSSRGSRDSWDNVRDKVRDSWQKA